MIVRDRDENGEVEGVGPSNKSLEDAIIAGLVEVVEKRSRRLQDGLMLPMLDVKELRRRLNMSQQDFSEAYGVPLSSLRNWEQGRRKADTLANLFLHIIDNSPESTAAIVERLRREVEG